MVSVVELAVEALARLPARDQERIGRHLLSYIEKMLELRSEIDKGSRALEAGGGEALDVEDFLRRQSERDGRG